MEKQKDFCQFGSGEIGLLSGKSVKTVEAIEWYGPLCLPGFDVRNADNAEGNATSGAYVVRQGDTLSKIAKALNVSKKHLITLNKIVNPDKIRAGRVLKY